MIVNGVQGLGEGPFRVGQGLRSALPDPACPQGSVPQPSCLGPHEREGRTAPLHCKEALAWGLLPSSCDDCPMCQAE
jgi:hypothetical protein